MIKALTTCLNKGIGSLKGSVYFPKVPTLYFRSQMATCPKCSKKLTVAYTETTKHIVLLDLGKINAHHTVLACPACSGKKYYTSEELRDMTPKNCNFGYDTIVEVGKSIFAKYRTQQEVVQELAGRNVFLSGSEVGYLAQKFVIYLSIAHRESGPQIKESLCGNGGFILHLDGTNEGGSRHLLTALDEISKFVLTNSKISSENANDITPLLQKVKRTFGAPLAVVTDMAKAMLGAVSTVFIGVLHFICHFHFLRDIGKDLFEDEYGLIRNTLKKNAMSKQLNYRKRQFAKTRPIDARIEDIPDMLRLTDPIGQINGDLIDTYCYTMVMWALDGKNHGSGYGFPFDKPHWEFYKRLSTVYTKLNECVKILGNDKFKKMPIKLINVIEPLAQDEECSNAAMAIEEKSKIFEKLRKAMRIALPGAGQGLNDDGDGEDMKTIEKQMKVFKKWAMLQPEYEKDPKVKKMVRQIEKYWEKLFADPITVDTRDGKKTIIPQRTNNISEQFFRSLKKDHCRTTGNSSICKKLQTMLSQTPLIKNLENPEYMKILLNGKGTLVERFADIDDEFVRRTYNFLKSNNEKIPIKVKKIVRDNNSMKMLLNLFTTKVAS